MKTKQKKSPIKPMKTTLPEQFSLRYAQAIEHTHELALVLAKMTEEEIKGALGMLNATFATNKVPYALLRTYRKAERAAWGTTGRTDAPHRKGADGRSDKLPVGAPLASGGKP